MSIHEHRSAMRSMISSESGSDELGESEVVSPILLILSEPESEPAMAEGTVKMEGERAKGGEEVRGVRKRSKV